MGIKLAHLPSLWLPSFLLFELLGVEMVVTLALIWRLMMKSPSAISI